MTHPHPARLPARRLVFAAAAIVLTFSSFAAGTAGAGARPAIVPREVISLFDGRSLDSFYPWLPKFGRNDPDKVFTVVKEADGTPAIRISGQHYGGITTRESYRDYRLVVEYRWGSVTWAPRETRARDSGILLHLQGDDGNRSLKFDAPWARSVEYQIIEGGTGDIILIGGYDRGSDKAIDPKLTVAVQPGARHWDPAGTPTVFSSGRLNWQHRDLKWTDTLGFRGPRDLETPVGQWNRIEIVADGDSLDYYLNGTKVNEGRKSSFTEGKLLFQSEGAEIFFRRIELHPLKPRPRS